MLCKSLSHDEINLDSKILSLSYNSGSRQENWSLSCVSHNETQRQNLHYDAVVMTVSVFFCQMWDANYRTSQLTRNLCTLGSSVQCEGNEGYERRATLSAKLSPRGNCVFYNPEFFLWVLGLYLDVVQCFRFFYSKYWTLIWHQRTSLHDAVISYLLYVLFIPS